MCLTVLFSWFLGFIMSTVLAGLNHFFVTRCKTIYLFGVAY